MPDAQQPNRPEDQEAPESRSAVRKFKDQLNSWLKDNSPEMHSTFESALDSAAELADRGIEGAKVAVDMLGEFAHDLTGVESFRVIPKPSMALEVGIRCDEEQEIILKQQLAPLIELYSLRLGRRINFEALINKARKGLQIDINDGMSLAIAAPLVGLQTVEIKGSGLLTRDDRGELVLSVTTRVPGLDSPVTVTVPIRHFIRSAKTLL